MDGRGVFFNEPLWLVNFVGWAMDFLIKREVQAIIDQYQCQPAISLASLLNFKFLLSGESRTV